VGGGVALVFLGEFADLEFFLFTLFQLPSCFSVFGCVFFVSGVVVFHHPPPLTTSFVGLR